ncbi:MAG: hypothetical protein QXP80_01525 [Zestosphaera sp.]
MTLLKTGIALILLGFTLVFIAAVIYILIQHQTLSSEPQGGFAGCVVIFFIPVCFGVGTSEILMPLLLASILTVLLLIIAGLTFFKMVSRRGVVPET